MKNLLKFFAFVALLSLAISALYDYRLKHGGLSTLQRTTPEKYTLASSPNVDPKQVASLEALNRERRALVSAVVPSVVAVKTTKKIAIERQNQLDPFGFFFRRPRGFQSPNDDALVQNSLGSGVIVTDEGHIITNTHVVDQVDEIEVQLSDGRTEKARLVGADEQVDLAVLKIDSPGVKPLKLADSDTVQAGDFVLAIGNPFGFEETVTDGIVSSKGRPNRADVFGDLIQTNAAINPGNSGGPLINLISQADLNKKVELEIVRAGKTMAVATQIKEQPVGYQTGRVTPQQPSTRPTPGEENESGNALAGIHVGQLTPDLARQLDLPNGVHGVVVTAVDPDAGAADLQKGDVIEEVNQQPINSVADYNKIIQSLDTRQAQVISVCRHRVRSFLVLRPR